MKLAFVTFVVIFSVFYQQALSYKACKKTEPAENLDSDWYYDTLQKGGHYVHATAECQNCEAGDKAFQWLRQRTTPKKLCFRIHGVTPEGFFNINAYCEIANPVKLHANCELDFTKYETKITMKGTATVFLTDNQHYIVTNFCIFGKENLWYLSSPKPTIDSKKRQEVYDTIAEMGFDTNVAVEGVSPVVFKNYTMLECKS